MSGQEKDQTHGWAWVHQKQRPIISAEKMTKGIHNGYYKVVCGNGQVAYVQEKAIYKWPTE